MKYRHLWETHKTGFFAASITSRLPFNLALTNCGQLKMQAAHTAETGHDLLVCLAGSDWDGFCFNCAIDHLFQEISGEAKEEEDTVKLLRNCMEALALHYSMDSIDNLVMMKLYASIVDKSGLSKVHRMEKLWTTICVPLLIPRLNESRESFSLLLSQITKPNNLYSGLEVTWLKGIQSKLIRNCVLTGEEAIVGNQDILDCNILILSAMKQKKGTSLDIGDVFGRMEVVYCVAQVFLHYHFPIVPPSASKVLEVLLAELSADYTAILSAQKPLNVLADLSVPRYKQCLFGILTYMFQMAQESAAETEAVLAGFVSSRATSSHSTRHVLPQMAQCALSLVSATSAVNDNAVAGLECILALLELASMRGPITTASATTTEIASRLLAEDCNYGSKLFALLEQTHHLQQQGSTANDSTPAAAHQLLEHVAVATFQQLAYACPARYFHYSLFTSSVCTSLCRRYLHSVQTLAVSRARDGLLPVLEAPVAENTTAVASAAPRMLLSSGTGHQQRASCLQSILIEALRCGACAAPAVHSLLQTCGDLLLSNSVAGLSVAGKVGLLAHCLPLLQALLQSRKEKDRFSSRKASIVLPESSMAAAPAPACVLHGCALLAEVVAVVFPLPRLRQDLAKELRAASVACLKCVSSCLISPTNMLCSTAQNEVSGERVTEFTSGLTLTHLAQVVSYAVTRVLFDPLSGLAEQDEMFLSLLALLALPPLHPLHRRAFDSRLLHGRLARYALSRCALLADSATTLSLPLLSAYASFLHSNAGACAAVDALRHGLENIVGAVRADADRPQHLDWSALECKHIACVIVSLVGASAGVASAVGLDLCVYLACCLDPSGSALTHLSPSLATDGAGNSSNNGSAGRGLFLQGLALLQDPRQVCAVSPETLQWLLLRQVGADPLLLSALSTDQHAVLLTFCVLLASHSAGMKEEMSALCKTLLWQLPQYLPMNSEGEGESEDGGEVGLFSYWASCSTSAATSLDPSAPIEWAGSAVKDTVLALLVPRTVRVAVQQQQSTSPANAEQMEKVETLLQAVQSLVQQGLSAATSLSGVSALATAVDTVSAGIASSGGEAREQARLWTFLLSVLQGVVTAESALHLADQADQANQTDQAAQVEQVEEREECEGSDLHVRVLERAAHCCCHHSQHDPQLVAWLVSTWEIAYCCTFSRCYTRTLSAISAAEDSGTGGKYKHEVGELREFHLRGSSEAAQAAVNGTRSLTELRTRSVAHKFTFPDLFFNLDSFYLLRGLYRFRSLLPRHDGQQSTSSVLHCNSLLYRIYSTAAETILGVHNVLLLSKSSSHAFVPWVEQSLLQAAESAAAVADAGRGGCWRLASLILSAGSEPNQQPAKERAEVLRAVHALSLSCLAATLLRLSQQKDEDASVAVLLRCALLRAQELLLECEAALFGVTDIDKSGIKTNRTDMHSWLVESVRELQRCAALFCSTFCMLALLNEDTCAEQQHMQQQAWHSLWAQPPPLSVPHVHSSEGDTCVSSATVLAFEPAAAVYELSSDLEYTQHCRRAWSCAQSSSLPSCSEVAAALVLDRAVAVHALQLLR